MGSGGSGDDGHGYWLDPEQVAASLALVLRIVRRYPPLVPATLFAFVRPFRRAVRVQLNIIPIVVQLKLFERRGDFPSVEAKATAREIMDERLAERFASFIGRMRGAFVKVAQVLSSLEPSPVRPAYVRRLEPMTEAAPGGRAWRRVERQISRELRRRGYRRLSDVFSDFDPVPLGTASVGQVHRAVLRADGRVVAVKLQYRDAQGLILNDLGTIHRLLKTLL